MPVDFDQTFDEFYLPLVRYCQGMTGERDVAEDIAQEALVRMYTHRIEGPPHGIRAWLFRTAIHLIRDQHKVDRNRRRLLEEHPVKPAELETPDTSLERREARARARAALDELQERDREILLLRYSGFSYKEIAEAVDVASSSVGTLLARAERRFADVMTNLEAVS